MYYLLAGCDLTDLNNGWHTMRRDLHGSMSLYLFFLTFSSFSPALVG